METNPLPDPIPEPARKRRTNRSLPWWITVPILLLVVGGLAGGVFFASLPKNGLEATAVDDDVRKEIQIGTSTREDARTWAANRGYTEVSDTFDPGGKKNGLMTQIPNDTWMRKQQVMVQFSYDRAGLITKISVYQSQRVDGPPEPR